MFGMNKLQTRYFRNAMTAWVFVTFGYVALCWIIPWSFGLQQAVFMCGSLVYGLWFFWRV